MHPSGYFSHTFEQSREKFLRACASQNILVAAYVHPLSKDDAILACDVAYIGVENPNNLLILVSGVHGVELYPGSACQTGWLETGGAAQLSSNTGCLLVHAINPWGAAHYRRNTEDNIDLARNFCDFSKAAPINEAYGDLHQAIMTGQPAVDAYAAQCGPQAFVNTLMQGQYTHKDGFGYGGIAPCWSNTTLRAILEDYCEVQNISVIEYHSGLGPYGYGMAVTFDEGDALDRTKSWFGPWTVAPNDRAKAEDMHEASGHTSQAYKDAFSSSQLSAIVLEYGTVEPQTSLPIMLEDHRLTVSPNADSGKLKAVRSANLAVHNPDDPDWQQAIWDRSNLAIKQALRGLEGEKT